MNSETTNSPRTSNIHGLINLAVVFGIVWLLWYLFMDPNKGLLMKLYTPMYGFSLVVGWFSCIVLLSTVTDGYPFGTKPSFTRAIVLTGVSFGLMLVVIHLLFWNGIGRFGVAYFSPSSIVASGGTGAEPWNARENCSRALVYFFAAFIWLALFWKLGFGNWPWGKSDRRVIAWSRFIGVSLFTVIAYAVLFHPHVCYLFYPPQSTCGVQPWWISFAGTGDAFFSLGLVLCAIVWIVYSDLLWEGRPWSALGKGGEKSFAGGIVTWAGTMVAGIILFYILVKLMIIPWDVPFEGGQYTDAPYFRYLHAGEISGFFLLGAFALKYYFNNWPNTLGLWPRAIIRTAIAMAGGIVAYLWYYSSATTFFLGKVYGYAQPDDTPLVWTILFLCIILIQAEFFNGWPLKKMERS